MNRGGGSGCVESSSERLQLEPCVLCSCFRGLVPLNTQWRDRQSNRTEDGDEPLTAGTRTTDTTAVTASESVTEESASLR